MRWNGTDTVKIADNVVWQEIENKTIILNLDNGFYFTLNDTARRIWYYFTQTKAIDFIINAITDEYRVSKTQARQDLDGILQQCLKEKLITIGVEKEEGSEK